MPGVFLSHQNLKMLAPEHVSRQYYPSFSTVLAFQNDTHWHVNSRVKLIGLIRFLF